MGATTNLSVLTLCDSTTGLAGSSGGLDTQDKKQGTGSYTYQTPKNGIGDGNFTPASAVDMSGTDMHLIWWMQCAVMASCELLNTSTTASGLMCKIESSGGSKTFHVAGRDTWGGEWKPFILDYNRTTEIFETVGTLDLTAVTKISFLTDNSNSGTIRIIDNTWLDAIRYGVPTITVTGADVNYRTAATEDRLSTNMWGIAEYKNGVITLQGRIDIDDGGGTTTFNSTNEKIAFADDFVSSGLYKLDFTGSGNTVVIKGLNAFSSGTNENTRPTFNAGGTVGSFTMSGSNFDRIKVPTFKAGQDIQTTVFNNTYKIIPSTATFKVNTISNSLDTVGALLFPTDDTNFSDCKFINNLNSIEYASGSDSTAPTLYGHDFDDVGGQYDINNTSGATIEMIISGGGNANSYDPGGDIVTFSNPKSFKFTVNPSITGYEWRLYYVTAIGSLDGSVEQAGEESATLDNQTFNYNYSTDQPMAVQIIALASDKEEEISYYTLKNANQDVEIILTQDTNN